MPEIKNTFTQGKMNQDLDERIVPNGQYIDAMNIKVTSSDDASVGVVQNILGNYRVEDVISPGSDYICIATIADEKNNKLYWFVTQEPSSTHAILEYNLTSERTKIVLVDKKNDTLKFTRKIITGINIIDNLLFWTDNYSEPKKINIDDCIKGTIESNPTITNLDNAFHTRLIVDGVDKGDISEKNITVIRKSPKQSPTITINKPTDSNAPKLFEQVFPRFSFRYKYNDGQYSSFGPFTQVVFNPVYVNAEYGREDAYSTKDSHNLAMVNQIKSIDISNFVSSSTPEDVMQVEILYKEDGSSVVFSIKTIDYDDIDWNNNSYTLESETIFAAIPSNQFLRPWDNVPRKALAQEITGNRIVYGNYTQGYDLLAWNNFKVGNKIQASFGLRENISTFAKGGLPSLKTQRNYQVGFVWGDKYGRETPVFTSEDGGVNIPWYNNDFEQLASKSLFLKANLATFIPVWADYYKVYVKETSGDYYNLLMPKAYPSSSLSQEVFDKYEDRVWISFQSTDRNKVTEDDYLIIKKQLIGNHKQVPLKNKFKILDIQNEVPDAIKFKYTSLGAATQTSDSSTPGDFLNDDTKLFSNKNFRIDQVVDMIHVNKTSWLNTLGGASLSPDSSNDNLHVTNLYIYWKDTVKNSESERYNVVGINVLSTTYRLKLEKEITSYDAALADINGVEDTANDIGDNIKFFVDRKDEKDIDQFSGKFFVQIVYKIPVEPEEIDPNAPTVITGQQKSNWFYDPTSEFDATPLGIINTTPISSPPTATSNTLTGSTGKTEAEGDWVKLAQELDSSKERGFFIDNMAMVAGQPFNDNTETTNVKISGKTWIGWLEGPAEPQPHWNIVGSVGAYNFGWTNFTFNPDVNTYPQLNASYSPRAFSRYGNNIVKDHLQEVNGLEGFLTTKEEHVGNTIGNIGPITGYRRWKGKGNSLFPLAGLGDDTYGLAEQDGPNGVPGVQPNASNRFFIHLSFLAPGEDLHDGNWDSNAYADAEYFGVNSPGNHMQAIWGGGVFTSGNKVLEMEGNYDASNNPLAGVPGPGTGQGYDNRFNYAKKNKEQWNPAWPPSQDPEGKIATFISNITNGGRFHFSSDPDTEFRIIGDVKEKRIYNHTPWVAQYKWNPDENNTTNPTVLNNGLVLSGNSVDEAASVWLDTDNIGNFQDFQNKITSFGRANNRRVVYIFEVDKNPVDYTSVIPVGSADFDSNSQLDITFVSSSPNVLLKDLIKGSAIWETEAKPGEDLDLYYEASQAIPIRLTDETNELFAPIGSRVEILLDEARNGKHTISSDVFLESWISNKEITLTGGGDGSDFGFNVQNAASENIDYTSAQIRFFRPDGSYTTTRLTGIPEPQTGDFVAIFNLDPTTDASMEVGLSYFNCYSFGNGIESNRIRDDFNAPSISKGVKASLVLDQEYKEENRKHGLIYSGIYNSTSGVNNLNQFIMAENITKDLNPTYGSIQKLFQRRISLVAFCEDRVVSITSNKDSLFNADGNSQLVSTNNVLGDATPFVGDFGISKNPESFAKESYRAYFADKQRGAVLRLSMDGITAISDAGMDDYFRDNLKLSGEILGSYDAHSKNYNITMRSGKPGENIITNNSISIGTESEDDLNLTPQEIIIDGEIDNFVAYTPGTNFIDVGANIYENDIIEVETTIKNYDEIGIGELIQETQTTVVNTISNTTFTIDDSNPSFYFGSYTDDTKPNPFFPGQDDFKIKSSSTSPNFPAHMDTFQYPTHINGSNQESSSEWFYDASTTLPNGTSSYFTNFGHSNDVFWNPETDSYNGLYDQSAPSPDQPWFYQPTTSNVGTGIVFDGTSSTSNIFTSLIIPGESTATSPNHLPSNIPTQYPSAQDNTIFNGEEVKLRFFFRNAANFNILGSNNDQRFVNIQLYDGDTALSDSFLLDTSSTSLTDADYSTYHVTPTTDTYELGYATTASTNFAVLDSSNNKLHQIYFKFTNGTENEEIVIQDLQVRISMLGSAGHTGFCFGSISSLNIRKVFELTSAFEQETITTDDGNPVPNAIIPAFATVMHAVRHWNLTDTLLTNNLREHLYTKNAKIVYGYNFGALTTHNLTQAGTGATTSYVFPTSGNVSNGTVFYNDGIGDEDDGMYADNKYLTDDVFVFDNELGGIVVQQSVTVSSGDWYFIDLIYNSYIEGEGITIKSSGDAGGILFQLINTELYGSNQDVLRAVFQVDDEQSNLEIISIQIPDNVSIEIEDFKLIRINNVYTGGDITHWNFNNDPNPPNHSFDVPSIYGSVNGVEFDVANGDARRYVYQNFITPPTPTNDGYKLEFKISNYISGSLKLYTIGVDTDGNPEGITIENVINANGDYSIDFNFDDNSYDLTKDSVVVGQTIPVSSHSTQMQDLVIFQSNLDDGFVGCVKNISLIDQTNYYTSSIIDSFNISGFDQQLNTYIDFQETSTGDGQIVFTNAPIQGDIGQVQIGQLIDKEINQNETYRLKFDYHITSGAIGVYYFSSTDNKGFIVEGLTGENVEYNVIHTINEDYTAGYLKDTLVFFVYENDTTGTIDNVMLRQEFIASDISTTSFSENVRGWVSKKSFIPEQGVSISSEYFTMDKGRLYKHNYKAGPRNTFYGVTEPSTITAVLNESPSSVKIFNTLNYEGSQSKVIEGNSAVAIDGNTYSTLETYNLIEDKGWSVDYIKTDKQEGSLNEFIEKEGKWFNYIKGLSTDVKTSDLSFQGLGIVKTETTN